MHSKQKKLMVFFFLAALLAAVPGLSLGASSTLDIRVSVGSDDAEEDRTSGSLGNMLLTSDDLDMITDPGAGMTDRLIGLRFRNVTVPHGATVTGAYIEFTVDEVDSNAAELTIWGEDADNSGVFSTANSNISNRTKTVTYVTWNVPAWATVGEEHQSDDLTDIVQEIIDRPGWTGGNVMTFIIGGAANSHRVAESYEAGSSIAPLLHIEYTPGIIDVFPGDSSDDAEESNSGDMNLTDDQLELIRVSGSDQSVGIRFPNVTVPQGAIITSAYLEFTAPVSSSDPTGGGGGRGGRGGGGGFTDLDIHGEDTDNAAAFTSTKHDVSSCVKTGNIVEWNALPSWAADNDYASPDLKTIIQEIVGRSGWSSGNAMAFIITGNGQRIAESYDGADGDASRMPRLHIEYYEDIYPYITVDKTVLGASCYFGKSPAAEEFVITNTGSGTMNYTIYEDADWLSLSQTSGTLAVGESVTITATYDTSAKAVGTYNTTITIEDSNASNTPVEVASSVSVFELPEVTSCDHIPLYATDIVSPSILILLDVSGSMANMMDVQPETFPQTPDLSTIVQEIVDRAAWSEGNAMAFIISGSGERNAVAYDGESGYAPLLHVEYNDGSDDYTLEVAVNQSSDDAEESVSGHMYLNSNDLDLIHGDSGGSEFDQTVGIRFRNVSIPPGVTITKAYIELAISESNDTDTDLVIKGEDSDNADTFAGGWSGGRGGGTWEDDYNITSRTTTTAQVAWDDVEAWEGAPQKSRIDIGKSAISSLVTDRQISWGFGTWTDQDSSGYTSGIDYTKIHVGCKTHTETHQTNLQNAISAATTHRATPFQPSLAAGRKYFAGSKSDEDGDDYVNNDCESLVLVEVTDGLGNTGTTLDGVKNEAGLLADNNISLVTVGFGIDDASQIQAAAAIANERGNASDEDRLYALHDEESGVGVPFLANNETELIDALSSIKSAVLDNLFHGSAPAPTTTTDLGDLLLVATFNASDWSGNLEAVAPDENGDWTDEDGEWLNLKWSAVDEMPVSRSIFTVNPSDHTTIQTYATWLTDYMTCKDMGDIINSTPIVVNKPSSYYDFHDYRDFATDDKDTATDGDEVSPAAIRDSMVYVGANDGALHAFSLATGEEQWAFVPEILQAKLLKGDDSSAGYDVNYDMCNAEYCHQYYVDGSPQVADIYTQSATESEKSWKTVLVSGLGEGGEAYFALDITSGNAFDTMTNPTLYMWEFTDTDLGESLSKPSINRVTAGAGTTWAVYFGSGYASTAVAQVDKEAYLYGIEAQDTDALWTDGGGSNINKIKIFDKTLLYYDGVTTEFSVGETITGATSGATATIAAVDSLKGVLDLESLSGTFQDNETINGDAATPGEALVNGEVQDSLTDDALASPLVADLDGGGTYIADQIYVGNLYGTMFRVSAIGFGQNPQVTTLVDLGLASNDLSPIRAKANYAFSENADEIWVYWGTGIYETQVDKVNMEQQYFFGVRDQLGATDETELGDMAALDAKYITSGGSEYRYIDGVNPDKDSWYIKLDNTSTGLSGSERILKSSLVAGGVVFFTTFIPGTDVCSGSGEAWLFAVDYETGLPPGLPTTDVNGDGVINWFDVYGIMDMNGDGVVDCDDLLILDPNGNGEVDPGDMVKDVNGDGYINWFDIAGVLDENGDGIVNDDDVVDSNSDGTIDWSDVGNDVNGDGVVDYHDFSRDRNGDGYITWDDVDDVNGDGVVDCWDLGDLNGDGVIDWSDVNGDYEPVFDVNGDGVIDEYDIVFDEDGNPVPVAAVHLGDDDGGGIASNPVLSGNDELFVNLTESGSEEVDVNLPALAVRLESWQHAF